MSTLTKKRPDSHSHADRPMPPTRILVGLVVALLTCLPLLGHAAEPAEGRVKIGQGDGPFDDAGRRPGDRRVGFRGTRQRPDDRRRLLFDTGSRPGTVLANARELDVDLAGVSDVVLSHHHGDHTGGLLTLRRELVKANPKAACRGCYVGSGIFLPRPSDDGRETNDTVALKEPYEATGGRFEEVGRPTEISPGVWLTGPVSSQASGAELERSGTGPDGQGTGRGQQSREDTSSWCSTPRKGSSS